MSKVILIGKHEAFPYGTIPWSTLESEESYERFKENTESNTLNDKIYVRRIGNKFYIQVPRKGWLY